MINSQLYTEYVDGQLSEESVEEFVEKMVTDSEFRVGFKSFITISSSINKSSKNFAISQNEKNELFSILKSSYPLVPAPNPLPQSIFQSTLFKYFLVGIVSSIFTLVISYFLWKPNVTAKQVIKESSVLSGTKQIPPINQLGNQKIDEVKGNKPIIKYIYLTKKDKQNPEISVPANNKNSDLYTQSNNRINRIDIRKLNSSLPDNRISPNNVIVPLPLSNLIQTEKTCEYNNLIAKKSKFRIELNNSPSWFYFSPQIQPFTSNKFNNFSFSIAYGCLLRLTLNKNTVERVKTFSTGIGDELQLR